MPRHTKGKVIEGVVLVIIGALIALMLSNKPPVERGGLSEGVAKLTEGWYYIENGNRVDVTLPAAIASQSGELTLYYDGLTAEHAGETLTTRGAVYDLKMSLGDKTIYEYDDASFPRNEQMASKVNCMAVLPENLSGETLALSCRNTSGGAYKIGEVCVGEPDAIFFYNLSKDAASYGTVFAMAILGGLALCIAISLKFLDVEEKRFLDVAAFLLCCVCWFLTDSSLAQTIAGSSPVIRYVSFYAFMLLAVPMLHFVKNTRGMEKYRSIDVCIGAFYANVIGQSLLNYAGAFDMIDMLVVTHLLLAGGIAVVVTLMVKEYRESRSKELREIIQAFSVVAGGGLTSLVLYWLLRLSKYEVFFECGIVLMIILLLRILLIAMVRNVKFKAENMVYQRLAEEDHMTGMKNRRAFNNMIADIEKNTAAYQNLFLVFMDLNQLKAVNDHLGHGAGDELIISAGGCITRAFGQYGSCFRLGGDEFCAILPNPTKTAEEFSALLDREIALCNETRSQYKMSIARGISSIRDDDGSVKSISDWKQEADFNMYENKGWMRRTE